MHATGDQFQSHHFTWSQPQVQLDSRNWKPHHLAVLVCDTTYKGFLEQHDCTCKEAIT
jgi:hypothetical protein